jgi:hypothetical protein
MGTQNTPESTGRACDEDSQSSLPANAQQTTVKNSVTQDSNIVTNWLCVRRVWFI